MTFSANWFCLNFLALAKSVVKWYTHVSPPITLEAKNLLLFPAHCCRNWWAHSRRFYLWIFVRILGTQRTHTMRFSDQILMNYDSGNPRISTSKMAILRTSSSMRSNVLTIQWMSIEETTFTLKKRMTVQISHPTVIAMAANLVPWISEAMYFYCKCSVQWSSRKSWIKINKAHNVYVLSRRYNIKFSEAFLRFCLQLKSVQCLSVCPSVCLSQELFSEKAIPIDTKEGEKVGTVDPQICSEWYLSMLRFRGVHVEGGCQIFFTEYSHVGYQMKGLD